MANLTLHRSRAATSEPPQRSAPPAWRSAFALSKSEVLLFGREPAAVFFTLVFPMVLLLFVGIVYGQEVEDDGLRYIDIYFPTLLAAVAANLGVMGLAISMAESRTRGVLRRYKLAPFPFWVYMASQITVGLVMYAVATIGITATTAVMYGVNPKGPIIGFLAVLLLGLAFMMALGFLIGGMNATVRTSQMIGTVVFFTMFFGSGAAIPRSQFPPWLQDVTAFNPLTQISEALLRVYLGKPIGPVVPGLIAIAIGLIIISYLSRRFFSWEVTAS